MNSKRKHPGAPSYRELIIPTIKALQKLGGSGTIEEINTTAIELSGLSEEKLAISHDGGALTEVEYQLAWSRTYLKLAQIATNSGRGVWRLLIADLNADELDIKALLRTARANKADKSGGGDSAGDDGTEDTQGETEETDIHWKDQLLGVLKSMTPDAFERLTQLILRESGFTQVEVTGRSGDGGIDGIGILKIKGVLSFYVLFQCKRYADSVGAGAVRDFRGAMQGRSDKGVLITTGRFTKDAMTESKRDGAPPIELVDGQALCDLMKDLGIGVTVEMVEKIVVDDSVLMAI